MTKTRCVDLRSDTVTQPTPACAPPWPRPSSATTSSATTRPSMRCRSASPTCWARKRRCSCPAARRATCARIMSHCQRGDEYIVGQMAHTYRWEGGGAAVLGSVQPQPLAHQPDGTLALTDIEAAIKPDDAHFARTRLLAWRTPGRQGAAAALSRRRPRRWRAGTGWRPTWTARACSMPRSSRRHRRAREIAQPFDSVSVCFSKGLGAPVGSALVGSASSSRARIACARCWAAACARPGVLAAAALLCARPPCRAAGRRPCQRAAPGRWAAGLPGVDGRAAADQHRLRRPRRRACRRR